MTGSIQLELALDRVTDRTFNWYEDCLTFALNNLQKLPGQFTSEDLIFLFNESGNPKPLESRVWGAVMKELQKRKLIKSIGFVKYRKPEGHCKPSTLWERT